MDVGKRSFTKGHLKKYQKELRKRTKSEPEKEQFRQNTHQGWRP
jgi:hypothetical protein